MGKNYPRQNSVVTVMSRRVPLTAVEARNIYVIPANVRHFETRHRVLLGLTMRDLRFSRRRVWRRLSSKCPFSVCIYSHSPRLYVHPVLTSSYHSAYNIRSYVLSWSSLTLYSHSHTTLGNTCSYWSISVVPKVWAAPPWGDARGAKLFYSLKINKKHKYY
jgi:hypothetical protein